MGYVIIFILGAWVGMATMAIVSVARDDNK